MAPLIELFVGSKTVAPIDELVEQCNLAREPVQEILDIPDPGDWEHRISVKEGLQHPEVAISFTHEGEDYPEQRPGEIFEPTSEQILAAGQAAQSILSGSLGENPPVLMNAWHDTSFIVRDQKHTKPVAPLSPEVKAKLRGLNLQARIEVALSPKLAKPQSGRAGTETEPVPENPHQAVINEMSAMVKESLGLEPGQLELVLLYPAAAQTDFSVNIYLPHVQGQDLPVEVRDHLAQAAELILNANQTTQDPDIEATVWVLPGQPDVFPVPVPKS